MMAGLFPALYMSRFQPIRVLRGFMSVKLYSKITMRKALIVFQFTLSLVFIISTVIAYQQFGYVQDLDPGFNSENIVNVDLRGIDYQLFKQEISRHANVVGVSACDNLPGTSENRFIKIKNEETMDSLSIGSMSVDHDFIENLKMQLVAGRSFPETVTARNERCIILNETAVQRLGFSQPIDALGQSFVYEDGTRVEVIGIVKDFSQIELFEAVEPTILRYAPRLFRYANIQLKSNTLNEDVTYLGTIWKQLNPNEPFTYE